MKISLFPNIKANEPTIYSGNIETIAKGLLADSGCGATSKNQLPLWSPTLFEGTRNSKNAQFISCLVYDLDDGLTPFDTWRLFTDWVVIAHTSFSHKPQFHKYRIILPLKKVVPAEEWNRASKWGLQLWNNVVGRGEPDPKALKDRARIYFRYSLPFEDTFPEDDPRHPRGYFQTAQSLRGDLLELDWESIPKEEPKAEPRFQVRRGPITVEALEVEPRFRERIASQVGAKIVGNNARYIRCPQCGDNSVFYSIDLAMPNSMKWAQCNHKNTCKWWGSLKDLL
jgi:hypothetical protein